MYNNNANTLNDKLSNDLALGILLAVVYFLLAKIGFFFGALTANASLLWPPSGLTLFAIYVFGKRALAGLMLGAISVIQWLAPADALPNTPLNAAITLVMAMSSIGQAWLVVLLSRTVLIREFRVGPKGSFYFIGSVLFCCTIAATVSCYALFYVGIINFTTAIQSWAVWWAGDSIGILLLFPVLLFLFRQHLFKNQYGANTFLITCAGVGAVLLSIAVVGHFDRENHKRSLLTKAVNLHAMLQAELDLVSRDADTLHRYYERNGVAPDSFVDFSEPILARNSWLESVTAVPNNSDSTQDTSTYNFSGGIRLVRTDEDSFTPEYLKNDHLSIERLSGLFSKPEKLVKTSEKIPHQLTWRTRKLNNGATDSESQTEPLVTFINSLTLCNKSAPTCNTRQLVAIELNLTTWMRSALKKTRLSKLAINIELTDQDKGLTTLRWEKNSWSLQGPTGSNHFLKTPNYRDGKIPQLEAFGEHWQLNIGSEDITSWLMPSKLQILVFIAGVLIMSLLSAYLNVLHRHELANIENQKKLQAEVISQTEALRSANDWLLTEIEERKVIQEQLATKENHLRILVDNIPDPIWLKTPDGVYLSCNKAVEKLLNLNERDIVGRKLDAIIGGATAEALIAIDQLALNSNKAVRRETPLFVPTLNEIRYFDMIKIAVRDSDNKPVSILAISRDITEKKQVEDALQLAKKAAEDATHAKSLFLANMSHEIRTPLNAVIGYSQLLTSDQSLSDQQRERISAILGAGQRLLGLINDILDLSKIEAGALHLRSEFFDLYQEMQDVISLVKNKAIAKGLSFNAKIDLPNPAIVKSDQQKIGQIVLNLLGNAVKFTNAGDIVFGVREESGVIHFTIQDTGTGISSEEMQNLFTAFRQGKAGELMGGTGLGLVISKHIAVNLGGDLVLNSTLDKGTHAHLFLPLEIQTNATKSLQSSFEKVKIAPDSSCSVLVVEDDSDSRIVLVSLLRDSGCTVTEAINGEEGLQQVLTNTFDIVFTDIRMPVMQGDDMLLALRKQVARESLPVVAVSASSLEHERSFYLRQGFDEFVGKPYEFKHIYSVLAKLTKATFIFSNPTSQSSENLVSEKIVWKEQSDLLALADQLKIFCSALQSGDLGKSKSLFIGIQARAIGGVAHRQLSDAMKQYDLALAEKIVAELLNEMAKIEPSVLAT
jgi:two-component system, OmpR family, aerobic respiration control sensor histidine kinase ArcB